jgi:hypothetical protein
MTDAPMPFFAFDQRMPERVAVPLALHAVIEDACRRPICSVAADALASTSAYAHAADLLGRAFPEPWIHDSSMQRIALGAAFRLGLDVMNGSETRQ